LENQTLEAYFVFNISDQFLFNPGFKIPYRNLYDYNQLHEDQLSNLVFHIGMVELISYWKATCSPQVRVKCHQLDDDQVEWWKKLYYNGLGEFFYLNTIDADADSFMEITSTGLPNELVKVDTSKNKVLVPIGGGKDSAVTLEILKGSGLEVTPMMLNPREASVRTIETAGYSMDDSAVIERRLDKKLLELNERGFLNGHTPFSSLLAFFNLLVAALSKTRYIALSNESSASESTVPGTNVNHQYSKSLEFEEDFRNYYMKYISADLEYFSFLRPLNELQIAEQFVSFPNHLEGFRSCNVGSKTDSWCGKCPKCLFTYIMLSPFVSRSDLLLVFGKNLLDDISLSPIFDELTGLAPIKPFECVGTPGEVNAALWKTAEQFNGARLPSLLQYFIDRFGEEDSDADFLKLLRQFDAHHFIPSKLLSVLKNHIEDHHKTGFLAFLKNRLGDVGEILILGFGREGQSTFRLMQEQFAGIKIRIADASPDIRNTPLLQGFREEGLFLGDNYQQAIKHCAVVIKSPGVKLERAYPDVQITSQTELFLEYYRNQTIGVTGTKGKSTTVSIIHHLLNKAGVDNVLLGNIGVPPFDRVEMIRKDTVVVFELSAHQLKDIHVSPSTAVLLNIFPEHLDYFKDYAAYFKAKTNILRYQAKDDLAIVHASLAGKAELPASNLEIFSAEKGSEAQKTVNMEIGMPKGDTVHYAGMPDPIIGKHNENNVLAAMLAVEAHGIGYQAALDFLSDFQPLPHRLEFVAKVKGITFYNDSISTVPESTIAAVESLEDTDTLILGGYDRGLEYDQLLDFLLESDVHNFIFIGQVGEMLLPLFKGQDDQGKRLFFVEDLAEAVPIILKHTRPGAICLLSPAASSYDQFHNFEHRGDTFKALVNKIQDK
jgi:UDP-N-acetylmuramoylalanine--D-glutamate ligase